MLNRYLSKKGRFTLGTIGAIVFLVQAILPVESWAISSTSPIGSTNGVITCTTCATSSSAITDGAVVVGAGSQGVEVIGTGSDNQVLRGATGSNPAFGSLVEGDLPTDTLFEGDVGAGLLVSGNVLSTSSGETNFLATGALGCGAGTVGKILVHTTPIQYCDNSATPTLRYSAYGESDGDAKTSNALQSATTTVDISSSTAPTTGQILRATSSTAATWQDETATPGGSDTNIQYNSSGGFGGDSNFTTNGSGTVSVTGSLAVDDLSLDGSAVSNSSSTTVTVSDILSVSPASGTGAEANVLSTGATSATGPIIDTIMYPASGVCASSGTGVGINGTAGSACELGKIRFRGHDSSASYEEGVEITAYASEDWTSIKSGTNLEFAVSSNGNDALVVRQKINGDGTSEWTADASNGVEMDALGKLQSKGSTGSIVANAITASSTNPTPVVDGDIEWDTDDDRIVVGNGTNQTTFYSGAHTSDTDTTYTAGDGLDLSGTTFSTDLKSGSGLVITSTELDVDTAVIQARVSGTCSAGNSIREIAADGTVTCEADTDTDTDTTYTAGDNLTLDGTEFDVDDAFLINSGDDTMAGTLTAKGVTLTDGSTGPGLLKISEDTDLGTNYASFTAGEMSEDTAYTLPLALPSGSSKILQSTTSGVLSWVDDADTGTTYTAGDGLELSGTTFSTDLKSGSGLVITSTELDVDTAVIQARVSGTCSAGNSIREIAADGTVTCEADTDTDTDTTYTAGTGLSLSSEEFSIDTTVVTKSGTQTLTNKTVTTPTITLTQGATPTPTAEGDIQWDTDDDRIVVGNGTNQTTFYSGTHTADTDTTYTAGDGLGLSGTTFSTDLKSGSGLVITSTELDVDTAVIQARVSGTCSAGNSIREIAADGTVTCEADTDTDTDTTYTAGTGLSLSSEEFSIDSTVVTKSGTQTLTNKTVTTPTITLTQGTTPAPTTEGDIQWDTDNDRIVVGNGTNQTTFYSGAHTADTDTTYTAGTGLSLSSEEFSIDSTVVTKSGTQTLTNKTLTTPTIGDFTNAGHDHSSTANGGSLGTDVITDTQLDNDGNFTVTGDWDFGGGGIEVQNGTTPPTCTAGQLYVDTDATTGSQLMACEGSTFVAQGGGGTITALNNQAANRLVTIGSTTTQLDGEANLTFDGSDLSVTGSVTATASVTSGCDAASQDCGIVMTDNNSGGTIADPGSDKTKLHTQGGSLYVLHDGGTTPGIPMGPSVAIGSMDLGSADIYYGVFNGLAKESPTTSSTGLKQTMPMAITIHRFCCSRSADGTWDSGDTRVQTLYDDDSATDWAVTLDTSDETACDASGTGAIDAGSDLYIHSDETGGGNAGNPGQITCMTTYSVDPY